MSENKSDNHSQESKLDFASQATTVVDSQQTIIIGCSQDLSSTSDWMYNLDSLAEPDDLRYKILHAMRSIYGDSLQMDYIIDGHVIQRSVSIERILEMYKEKQYRGMDSQMELQYDRDYAGDTQLDVLLTK